MGVRTDHLQVVPEHEAEHAAPYSKMALITDVEYQGTYVLLGLQNPGTSVTASTTAEISVMLSESTFATRPYAVGETVQLRWAPEAAHPLAR